MSTKLPLKILTIDPSGTGTTGICLVEKGLIDQFTFLDFKSKDWQEHLKFIVSLVQEHQPQLIVFENTNYVYGRQHSGTANLYKLIGALVGLEYAFDFIEQIEGVLVNQVKGLRKKLVLSLAEVRGLTYAPGRSKGWKYEGQRINVHKLDAFLTYHLWARNNLPPLEQLETEIQSLKAKGKRMGRKQKERLRKLEKVRKLMKSYELLHY